MLLKYFLLACFAHNHVLLIRFYLYRSRSISNRDGYFKGENQIGILELMEIYLYVPLLALREWITGSIPFHCIYIELEQHMEKSNLQLRIF